MARKTIPTAIPKKFKMNSSNDMINSKSENNDANASKNKLVETIMVGPNCGKYEKKPENDFLANFYFLPSFSIFEKKGSNDLTLLKNQFNSYYYILFNEYDDQIKDHGAIQEPCRISSIVMATLSCLQCHWKATDWYISIKAG